MKFKLIFVVVDTDKTEAVLEAVMSCGATGATILGKARGVGLAKTVTFLGLQLFSSRDVMMVLVESRRADGVLAAALSAGKLDESLGTGIALQIDVEKAVGLSEHVKLLSQQLGD